LRLTRDRVLYPAREVDGRLDVALIPGNVQNEQVVHRSSITRDVRAPNRKNVTPERTES
jgi:hypothetical protein